MSNPKAAILQMVKENMSDLTMYSIIGKVTSVDLPNLTCDVEPVNGDGDFFDVRLQAGSAEQSILAIPKEGSFVIINYLDKDEAFVTLVDEVDEIRLRGNSEGGLVKVNDMVTRMNNIENDFNSFITTYNTHVHPGVTAGGASTLPTTSSGSTTSITVNGDIESTTVKQGD